MDNPEIGKPKTKIKRNYYKKGVKKSETQLANGVEHGICRAWYPSGQLKEEREYANGKMNGLWREWHENGQLSWETTQVNGQTLNGTDRRWREDGTPDYICEYQDGKIHGKYYKLEKDGTEVTEYWWHDKKLKYQPEQAALMIDFLTNIGYEVKKADKPIAGLNLPEQPT
jgi:antitoxin component YwqK of YwqJK toxin-antitoxin module